MRILMPMIAALPLAAAEKGISFEELKNRRISQ